MSLRCLMLGLASLSLIGCATNEIMTSYQDSRLKGGLTVEKAADGTTLVIASGNFYTPWQALQDYALLKAAELTLAESAMCMNIVATGTNIRSPGYIPVFSRVAEVRDTARVRFTISEAMDCTDELNAKLIAERLREKVSDLTVYDGLR